MIYDVNVVAIVTRLVNFVLLITTITINIFYTFYYHLLWIKRYIFSRGTLRIIYLLRLRLSQHSPHVTV